MTTQTLLDTSVMPTLHTFFRREFRLAGGLVRRVRPGDLQRAAVVADHLELIRHSLHHHHTVEDELLWPLLLERVPEEMAPLVHLMESQHARVDVLLETIGEMVPRFRRSADPEVGEHLADLLDELYVHLVEHLDAEEQRMLPIVAPHYQRRRVGRHERGRAGRNPSRAQAARPRDVPVRRRSPDDRDDAQRCSAPDAMAPPPSRPPRLHTVCAAGPRDADTVTLEAAIARAEPAPRGSAAPTEGSRAGGAPLGHARDAPLPPRRRLARRRGGRASGRRCLAA